LFNTVGPRQTGRYGMVLPRFIAAPRKTTPESFRRRRANPLFLPRRRRGGGAGAAATLSKGARRNFQRRGTEEVSILKLGRMVVKTLDSKSKIQLVPYAKAYPPLPKGFGAIPHGGTPGFDDMRRRKPLVKKLECFVKFRPRTTLREIIRLTAG